ncbi:hypothetical protein [Zobellella taiwanensis]
METPELGCHYVQGYGISHPVPAEAIAGWLNGTSSCRCSDAS